MESRKTVFRMYGAFFQLQLLFVENVITFFKSFPSVQSFNFFVVSKIFFIILGSICYIRITYKDYFILGYFFILTC